MTGVDGALATLAQRRGRWTAHLADFVSIPSVSGDQSYAGERRRAAEWLRARLRDLGMNRVRLIETRGSPLVWAEWCAPGIVPTVVAYGHYDVVPPGPLGEWRSAPFAPVRRGRFLYGRGASDDKGPLSCQLAALEAWLASTGRLPVNVTCVFDGEEETGSRGLHRLIRSGWRVTSTGRRADAVLISDTRMLAPGQPTVIVGLRGTLAAEIEVTGPARDVHSGAFGGAVRNPAQVLCEIVAGLHDTAGRITVPGMYTDVRGDFAARGHDGGRAREHGTERAASEHIIAAVGPGVAFGEQGFSAYERTTLRPALDVNGLAAGQTGRGAASIVPRRAVARLSLRLVPDQEPRRVASLLAAHLERHAPPGARVRVTFSKPARPVSVDPVAPGVRAARAALAEGFGRPPVLLRSGGTISVVGLLARAVGDPVLMGFALPDDGMHGPNERVSLDTLDAGARSLVHFLGLMRSAGAGRRAPTLAQTGAQR